MNATSEWTKNLEYISGSKIQSILWRWETFRTGKSVDSDVGDMVNGLRNRSWNKSRNRIDLNVRTASASVWQLKANDTRRMIMDDVMRCQDLSVCLSVCMYACLSVCLYVCVYEFMYVILLVCLHVCGHRHVCMHIICLCLCVCLVIYIDMSACMWLCMSLNLHILLCICWSVFMSSVGQRGTYRQIHKHRQRQLFVLLCLSVPLFVCLSMPLADTLRKIENCIWEKNFL